MNTTVVPRLAAPLLFGAAILVSFLAEQAPPPVVLAPGEPPVPSAAELRSVYTRAVEPAAPGYDRGATDAPVTVIEFADFGCRYCAQFALSTWPALAGEFVRTGSVRWRYVPFVMGMFPNGTEAAWAVECAADQGPAAFARMHDALFASQGTWKGAADPAGAFRSIAGAARLDPRRFAECYASDAPKLRVRASNDLADQMGVRSTPTFFVNGARIEGALPPDEFRAVLQEALRRSSVGAARR